MSNPIVVFQIVSLFPKYINDNEEYGKQDFRGDAYGYEVRAKNGNTLIEYGDDYHDRGSYKCEGFITGFARGHRLHNDDYNIEYVNEIIE